MIRILVGLLFAVSINLWADEIGKEQALYDFDHKVHYRQTRLDKGVFRLSIREGNYQHFSAQSVFLLRHSARLCRDSKFNLEFVSGVQEHERFPSEPRANPGPLVAMLSCNK